MTPKEKALKLVKIFQPHTDVHRIPIYHAKKCALIAVDEVLNNFGLLVEGKTHYCSYSTIDYYKEVKQEIEKL